MTRLIQYHDTLTPKNQQKLNNKYFKWLSTHDSVIGDVSFEYCIRHHLQFEGNHGTSLKPIDLYAIPIPKVMHNDFHLPPFTWKDTGNAYVEDKYGVNVVEILKGIHEEYIEIFGLRKKVLDNQTADCNLESD